ncbi:MAG: single-stranded-DNA-specific exonuclease RecJ [Anaerolineales bacterium]|nr:single-stranded-DNA-specific exonuclease RecJ [Anaerolineales bacterium]
MTFFDSRTWIEPPAFSLESLQAAFPDLHPLTAAILARRGLADLNAARAFLDPQAYTPAAPQEMPGVAQALPLLDEALRRGDHILVWGDFDVDGQTATALLVQALRSLGGRVSYHIPIRAQESHGISLPVLRRLLAGERPPRLLLTCDTGATAFEALEFAHNQGLTVIVSDHHELARPAVGAAEGAPRLPPAHALITPRLLPNDHPLSTLPGVGVAYKLVEGLCRQAGREELAAEYLDLVALGIVADVAELSGEARYLLQRGLELLRSTPRRGLQAIYEFADLNPQNLNEEHIGFAIAPRLNALGRLGDANPAVELLTTQDAGRARLLALQIEGLNARRQLLTSQTLRGALALIEQDPSLLDYEVLLLAHPAWEAGVIGIVASRLVERYERPVVLVSSPPGSAARGSARSVEGVDITAALATQADLLLGFGGHAMAAGFSVAPENLPALRRGLSRAVATQLAAVPAARPGLQIDACVDWAQINLEIAEQIERLAPFGRGNPAPVLVSRRLRLVSQSFIGREQEHLALSLEDENGVRRRVIWWGSADYIRTEPLPEGLFDLAFTLRATAFRGEREAQIEWVACRATPGAAVEVRRILRVDDLRFELQPLARLQSWLDEREAEGVLAETLIWAEGGVVEQLAGQVGAVRLCGRHELERCRALAVWSIPPSPTHLAAALAQTQAERVALFAVQPGFDQPQAFLERLAGLARYTLSRLDGRVALARLAAALAARETTVRRGLEWLAAQGAFRVSYAPGEVPSNGDEALLMSQPALVDAALAEELLVQTRRLLDETAAYRRHYASAERLEMIE